MLLDQGDQCQFERVFAADSPCASPACRTSPGTLDCLAVTQAYCAKYPADAGCNDTCPFATATAGNPCLSDSCRNASNTLDLQCCADIRAFCDQPGLAASEPACLGLFADRCAGADFCALPQYACPDQLATCVNVALDDGRPASECRCASGYEWNSDTQSCDDVDECALNLDNCLLLSTCVNKPGSYSCVVGCLITENPLAAPCVAAVCTDLPALNAVCCREYELYCLLNPSSKSCQTGDVRNACPLIPALLAHSRTLAVPSVQADDTSPVHMTAPSPPLDFAVHTSEVHLNEAVIVALPAAHTATKWSLQAVTLDNQVRVTVVAQRPLASVAQAGVWFPADTAGTVPAGRAYALVVTLFDNSGPLVSKTLSPVSLLAACKLDASKRYVCPCADACDIARAYQPSAYFAAQAGDVAVHTEVRAAVPLETCARLCLGHAQCRKFGFKADPSLPGAVGQCWLRLQQDSTLPPSSGTTFAFQATGMFCSPATQEETANAVSLDVCSWHSCATPGWGLLAPSIVADAVCAECVLDATYSYRASPKDLPVCRAVTACVAGQQVQAAPTLVTDRVCQACAIGTYSLDGQRCAPCAPGTYAPTPGLGQCLNHTAPLCGAGTFEALAPAADTDRVCKACPTGEYQPATNATACLPCFPIRGYTTRNATSCAPLTVCLDVETEVQAPTAVSDRMCQDVDACVDFPCSKYAAYCNDTLGAANSAQGRTCGPCLAGFTASSSGGCVPADAYIDPAVCRCNATGVWHDTTCGTVSRVVCDANTAGAMYRACKDDGTWSAVDKTACETTTQLLPSARDPCVQVPCSPNAEGCTVVNLPALLLTKRTLTAADRVCASCRAGYESVGTPEGEECRSLLIKSLTAEKLGLVTTGEVLKQLATLTTRRLEPTELQDLAGLLARLAEHPYELTRDEVRLYLAIIDNILATQKTFVSKAEAALQDRLAALVAKFARLTASWLAPGASADYESGGMVMNVRRVTRTSFNGALWASAKGERVQLPNTLFADAGVAEPTIRFLSYDSPTLFRATDDAILRYKGRAVEANSRVLGVEAEGIVHESALPDGGVVQLRFERQDPAEDPAAEVCVFFDFDTESWDATGCERMAALSTETHTVCQCSHLTNFAVLVDHSGDAELSDAGELAMTLITYIGCGVSVVCLLLTAFTYLYFGHLRTAAKATLVHLCLSLATAQLLFLITVTDTSDRTACNIFAAVLHFALMAAFLWMLAEAYHLYLTFVVIFDRRRYSLWRTALLCYGAAAATAGVTLGLKWDVYSESEYCWLPRTDGVIWAFIGPMLAIVAVNMVVLVRIFMSIRRMEARQRARRMSASDSRQGIRHTKAAASFMSLLGITWVVGAFAVDEAAEVFQYVFAVLNVLQGLLIFIFHCVSDPGVRRSYAKWWLGSQASSSGPLTPPHKLHSDHGPLHPNPLFDNASSSNGNNYASYYKADRPRTDTASSSVPLTPLLTTPPSITTPGPASSLSTGSGGSMPNVAADALSRGSSAPATDVSQSGTYGFSQADPSEHQYLRVDESVRPRRPSVDSALEFSDCMPANGEFQFTRFPSAQPPPSPTHDSWLEADQQLLTVAATSKTE